MHSAWGCVCHYKFVLCVQNAMALTKRIPLNRLWHQHAMATRIFTLALLLKVGQPPAQERVHCDAVDCREPKTSVQRWICCYVCGRWLHFDGVNISWKPRSAYVCVICTAQYDWITVVVCSNVQSWEDLRRTVSLLLCMFTGWPLAVVSRQWTYMHCTDRRRTSSDSNDDLMSFCFSVVLTL